MIRAGYSGDWVGLSCLMVAQRAFLQVEADNHAALALYHRLGFADVDTYHYRER